MGDNLFSKLNPLNWELFKGPPPEAPNAEEVYQAGEAYHLPDVTETGMAEDLKAIGFAGGPKQLQTLIDVMKSHGKPAHDREMTMEKMIALTASLPRTSKTRAKLTGVVIDTLWKSLQHPPITYLGDKFQYRSADGSYNNPLNPDLGKAGTPYAKSIRKEKKLKGTPPDPALLFDLLQARTPESFKENPAGISSMLFYHATIIIHDIFRSNRFDNNISDTSSYLDLAPLYGSSLKAQLSVRTMSNGLLKPDTFAEERLIGQPPGVNVMLVLYSRFHNYVAETLLKINEYERFSLPPTSTPEDEAKAKKKQDEDLFQTARLITNGLYIQICLHDYLRGLTNCHHSNTDWTLDPRIEVGRMFDSDGVPRGVGNQVTCEFNLLYRFHSVISQRDEKWTNDFLKAEVFPDLNKSLEDLTPHDFVMGLFRFEQSIPKEPSERTFGGLKRDPKTGRFSDADLTKILKESIEDPAGLFGPRMVPKALKMIEVAGILTARKWQVGSLNEMRKFFGLAVHETFEDINPDPEIADLLRKLYQHPDMVEMYPGMFLEDAKPRLDPGCGGCPPYTVGRAVFSDAVTLVRSDRFLTLDYTVATLTNWGMEEVERDLDVLGGSMLYKLIQRGLPYWFPYNSLHVMQPMFTRKMNETIAKEIGQFDKYTTADPAPPPPLGVVMDKATVQAILKDSDHFKVTWGKNFADMFGGKKNYHTTYMLAGDSPAQLAQGRMMKELVYASPDGLRKLIHDQTVKYAEEQLQKYTLTLKKDLLQMDILRDITIPVLCRILSDLFCLDLKSNDNPNGSLNMTTMYTHLTNVRNWGFNDLDPAMAWKRRMWAEKSSIALDASTKKSVSAVLGGAGILNRISGAPKSGTKDKASLRFFGQTLVQELAKDGQNEQQICELMWLSAVGGVGTPTTLLSDCLQLFWKNEGMWSKIQDLAADDSDASRLTIRKYVREAIRMTSAQKDVRICAGDVKIGERQFKAGDRLILLLGAAGQTIPDGKEFKLDRPNDDLMVFGYGPHQCLGNEIALTFVTAMVKLLAKTKNLRPAPGQMGKLKWIMQGQQRYFLNDAWSYFTVDPSTWTLHFEGYGKGEYKAPADLTAGRDMTQLFMDLKNEMAASGRAAAAAKGGDGAAKPAGGAKTNTDALTDA